MELTRSTRTQTGWFVRTTIVMLRGSSRSPITRGGSASFMAASADWCAFTTFCAFKVCFFSPNIQVFANCHLSQHLFASEHRDEIIRSAIEHAGNFIGITLRLRKDALTFEDFMTNRLGKYSADESITSLAEFVVQKITPRHQVRTYNLKICRFKR